MLRLARVIKEYRWAQRISQKGMAAHLGLDPSAMSRFENGKNLDAVHLATVIKWLLTEETKEGEDENQDTL